MHHANNATIIKLMESQTPFALNTACAGNPTTLIVKTLHRQHPGTKLAEQKLAYHFGVPRTLVMKNGRALARRAR